MNYFYQIIDIQTEVISLFRLVVNKMSRPTVASPRQCILVILVYNYKISGCSIYVNFNHQLL